MNISVRYYLVHHSQAETAYCPVVIQIDRFQSTGLNRPAVIVCFLVQVLPGIVKTQCRQGIRMGQIKLQNHFRKNAYSLIRGNRACEAPAIKKNYDDSVSFNYNLTKSDFV